MINRHRVTTVPSYPGRYQMVVIQLNWFKHNGSNIFVRYPGLKYWGWGKALPHKWCFRQNPFRHFLYSHKVLWYNIKSLKSISNIAFYLFSQTNLYVSQNSCWTFQFGLQPKACDQRWAKLGKLENMNIQRDGAGVQLVNTYIHRFSADIKQLLTAHWSRKEFFLKIVFIVFRGGAQV